MDLYTVIPLKGVVEPIDMKTFKKLYPKIKGILSNGYLVTNKPHTEKGYKALKKAGWIELNGIFIPPMQEYDQKWKRKKKS